MLQLSLFFLSIFTLAFLWNLIAEVWKGYKELFDQIYRRVVDFLPMKRESTRG